VELYLHSSNTSSWGCAWLSTGAILPLHKTEMDGCCLSVHKFNARTVQWIWITFVVRSLHEMSSDEFDFAPYWYSVSYCIETQIKLH
jgi:hypothetical protein